MKAKDMFRCLGYREQRTTMKDCIVRYIKTETDISAIDDDDKDTTWKDFTYRHMIEFRCDSCGVKSVSAWSTDEFRNQNTEESSLDLNCLEIDAIYKQLQELKWI